MAIATVDYNREHSALVRRVRTATGNQTIYDLGYYASASMIDAAYLRISKEMFAQGWNACAGDAVISEAIRRKFGETGLAPQDYHRQR